MKASRAVFFFLASAVCAFADLVPLFDHYELRAKEPKKYYMAKERFEEMREIKLTGAYEMPSLQEVSRTALAERKRRKPDEVHDVRVLKVTVYPITVFGKRLYFYEVTFETEDDLLPGAIHVAQDGKLIPAMKHSEWKKRK